MTTQATNQRVRARGKRRGSALLVLALGGLLAASVAVAGTAQATTTGKIFFTSNRTTGTGVNNPTGDFEIFKMNPDGTSVRQLTSNKVDDFGPTLSPDETKVAYMSRNVQTSNPEGDLEVYRMNASDGTGKRNLTNNGADVHDRFPVFSPNGKRIAYESEGIQTSNPEGDSEVYRMSALDGTAKKNLSNNGVEVPGASPVDDYEPEFSPDGTKVAYTSYGKQDSNPEGDTEIYRMITLDGTGKKNLSNNGDGVYDFDPTFAPDGKTIAYDSYGVQTSNSQGDYEVYRMNASDGTGKKNLTDNDLGVGDFAPVFSPGGKKVAYTSQGTQTSNSQGDYEVYRMNASDGTGKKNLTDNDLGVDDFLLFFSTDGTRIFYESIGKQTSNPEGDPEIYRMNTLDGSAKKSLTNNGEYVFDGILPA